MGKVVPIATRLERRKRIDRFSGCWEWLGATDPNGYGRITVDHVTKYVHRVSWELAHGRPIPDGHHVDHVCENKRCFNPEHLDAVTPRENLSRSPNAKAARTHCPSGHRYAGANLSIYTDKAGHTRRYCRTCRNTRNAARSV